jgi:uncharacterized membrane protein
VQTELGFRRLVNFADAVVAIAITLLVLPLVDKAGSIGDVSVSTFLHHSETRLLAFLLSFAVIGRYWWGQHQMFERARAYNSVLVGATFLWLLSIVFLPFPTELLSASTPGSSTANHALYVGTLLVASIAALIQEATLAHWPELQGNAQRGEVDLTNAIILVVLMGLALVIAVVAPGSGLWGLLLLVLSPFIEHLVARWRTRPRARRART